MVSTDSRTANETDSPIADHRIAWTLERFEWLAIEWPAVVFWGGWASFTLGILILAVRGSWWWLVMLPAWWLMGGAKAAGILVFLVRGGERNELSIHHDGTMFHSTNASEAVYAHWRGFVNQGESFLLWGADGRYRLVIPKRALAQDDYAVISERVGIDLAKLASGDEAAVVHSAGTQPS